MKRPRNKTRPLDRYPRGPALWVSEIVEQVYCETRVDLWLKDPGERVSVPRQIEGRRAALHQEELAQVGRILHAEMSVGAVRITEEQLQKRMSGGKQTTLLEMPLAGIHKKVSMIGRADAVCLTGRTATCVIDYKFTIARRLFPSSRFQLLIYGYLLQCRGLATDDLLLVAALIPQQSREQFENASRQTHGSVADGINEAARLIRRQATPIDRVWYGRGPALSPAGHMILQVFRYDADAARADLDRCMDYWLGKREARPSSNPNRCKICKYNQLGVCAVARARYSPVDPDA